MSPQAVALDEIREIADRALGQPCQRPSRRRVVTNQVITPGSLVQEYVVLRDGLPVRWVKQCLSWNPQDAPPADIRRRIVPEPDVRTECA